MTPSAASFAAPATRWPALPYDEWKETCATLHRWLQIVGKIRRVQTPWANHSWHVPLYLSARGLTTSPIPCGERSFEIDFDFIAHRLLIETSDGAIATLRLEAKSVADFYEEIFAELARLGLAIKIHGAPNEVADATPFAADTRHASYDAVAVNRFWRVLVQVDRVLKEFRSRFVGKASPVHFFWGSMDLAVTRFSGRAAPPHPGGAPNCPDWIMREAYSHELSSCGFWPGNEALPEAAFYAYAYPEPAGFGAARVRPDAAYYHQAFGEFILPYEALRREAAPEAALLDFLDDTYAAAAGLGDWDRSALESAALHAPQPSGK
jgi:hypothetical protein